MHLSPPTKRNIVGLFDMLSCFEYLFLKDIANVVFIRPVTFDQLGSILAVHNTFPGKLVVFGLGYTFLGKD